MSRYFNTTSGLALALYASTVSAQQVAPETVQQANVEHRRMSPNEVREVAPALEQYTQQRLYGEVWKRQGLSPRDRSLVSVAALIARGEAPALGYYVNQGLENGVKPAELSETIVQLAFYAGWGKAMASIGPVREVFAARGIKPDQLPPAFGPLQPLDAEKDAKRGDNVGAQWRGLSPSLVYYTNDVLFREVWQRPYLTQRDRSLVTIATLIADGKAEQLTYHLNRGMDQGLTPAQIGEVVTQLAFYAGWPSVFASPPVIKKVLAERSAKR